MPPKESKPSASQLAQRQAAFKEYIAARDNLVKNKQIWNELRS